MAAPKLSSTTQKSIAPKKIKLAFLHQAISIPGGINTEKTLSEAKVPGLSMAWSDAEGGLMLWHKNQHALIPKANVAMALYDMNADGSYKPQD